jgi:hypothetical protein
LPIRVPMLDEMPMRLKLTGIPGEADAALYVVLTPKALALDQAAMLRIAKPALAVTKADLAAALSGKDVTKILVLPRRQGEQTVTPGLEVVTSADLDPKGDLIAAALQRGAVVAMLLISKSAPPSPFTLPVHNEQLPFRLNGPEGLSLTHELSGRGKFDGQVCEVPAQVGLPFDGAKRFKLGGSPVAAKRPIYASLSLARPLPEAFLRIHASELQINLTKTDLNAAHEGKKVTCIVYVASPAKEGGAPRLQVLSSTNNERIADPIAEASRRGAILVTVLLSRQLADLPSAEPPAVGAGAEEDGRLGIPQASQIIFSGLEGMTIQWDVTGPRKFDSLPLVVPGRFNFPRGAIYALKLSRIPGHAGVEIYSTLEAAPTLPRTEAYLKANAIPIEFTAEDIDHILEGKPLTKVVYLPDPDEESALQGGPATLVSSQLPSSLNPILEADRRGAILAIIRVDTESTPVVGKPNASGTAEVGGDER